MPTSGTLRAACCPSFGTGQRPSDRNELDLRSANEVASDLPRIDLDTPLRLDRAVKLAFPDGGMGVPGLRREAKKGRLTIEVIAGKHFTTLRAIEQMREKCRVKPKAHTCSSEETGQTADRPHGSSVTGLTDAERIAARDSALMRLSEKKDEALAKYLANKHDPRPKGGRNPNEALVADCLSVYVDKKEKRFTPTATDNGGISRQKEDRAIARRLTEFFGLKTVGEVSGELQEEYAGQRGSQSSARRELSFLAAAINSYNKKKGGMNLVFSPVLPEASPARERWLTRQEAARLLRAAWRARQKNRGGEDGRHVGKHIARFILIGLYTGTRAGAICGAALTPAIGRGHVDLDSGRFHRKALGARDTNKRQPTVDIPPPVARPHAPLEAPPYLEPFGHRMVWQAREERAPGLYRRSRCGGAGREGHSAHPQAHGCVVVLASANSDRRRRRLCRHVRAHPQEGLQAPHAGALRPDHAGCARLRKNRRKPRSDRRALSPVRHPNG